MQAKKNAPNYIIDAFLHLRPRTNYITKGVLAVASTTYFTFDCDKLACLIALKSGSDSNSVVVNWIFYKVMVFQTRSYPANAQLLNKNPVSHEKRIQAPATENLVN